MEDEFNNLPDDEKLKAQNEFLKMKMMLEQGAKFGDMSDNDLSPEIENEFLKNVMAFEKKFAEERKTIKLFDKIEKPQHFKPANEIDNNDIDKAWDELNDYLREHGINLDACSPNVTNRELYRFTVEELFEHEMDDMDLPGWTSNFIYDEFYPDPLYDNSRSVEDNLFRDIFRKDSLLQEHYYHDGGIVLNEIACEKEQFIHKVNLFKSLWEEIELEECTVVNCTVNENDCVVEGNYKAIAKTGNVEMVFNGDFNIELIVDELGYWNFKRIYIEGFNPF
jgi:hypothetical protein